MPLAPDDPRWSELNSGYRRPYDPRPVVEALRSPATRAAAWDELWQELHHQGDVGTASYATVPLLVRVREGHPDLGWQFYALCSTIETERGRIANEALPDWLEADYREAWRRILVLALAELATSTDPLLMRCALTAIVLAKGRRKLGALLAVLGESEIAEWVEKNLSWSQLYRSGDSSWGASG
jgi:hypothetical protein